MYMVRLGLPVRCRSSVRAHPLNVCNDFSAVFEPRVRVLKLQAALFQKLTDESTNPTTLAKHQEHLQAALHKFGKLEHHLKRGVDRSLSDLRYLAARSAVRCVA